MSQSPDFLSLDDVLRIHENSIQLYGGASGIRDEGLLQSALATPQSGFGDQYLHGDIFEMAGVYLYHMVKNHPFVDGNKRTGVTTALVFLIMNGYELVAEEDALEKLVMDIASSQVEKEGLGAS